MLPTGSFAEVVGFLRLFYLSSLAATNALCSSLAVKASAEIRREELSGLHFKMWNNLIGISRGETQIVARLAFPSETATTEFIDAAFPKCILDDVVLSSSVNKRLLDAIGRVAGSVVVQRVLSLSGNISLNGSLGIARKFRKVKTLALMRAVSDDDAKGIANFYRESDVEELPASHDSNWYQAVHRYQN